MSQFISQLTHPIKIQQTAVVASGMAIIHNLPVASEHDGVT